MLIFFSHQFDTDFAKPLFFQLFFLEREEEAVPRGSGNTHPEDLPWLEVPHSFLLLKKSQVVVAAWYRRFAVSTIHYTCHRKHSFFSGINIQNFF